MLVVWDKVREAWTALVAPVWTTTSVGAADVGKAPLLGADGKLDGSVVPVGLGLTIVSNATAIDTAIVTRKMTFDVGDGVASSIVCTHNWNTYDVGVFVWDAALREDITCDVTRSSLNAVTLAFASPPTSSQFRALLLG